MQDKISHERDEHEDCVFCPKCQRSLPREAFARNITRKNMLQSWCKECVKQKSREYYERNKEKIKAKTKEYRQDNLEKMREANRRSARRYRAKIKRQNLKKLGGL